MLGKRMLSAEIVLTENGVGADGADGAGAAGGACGAGGRNNKAAAAGGTWFVS